MLIVSTSYRDDVARNAYQMKICLISLLRYDISNKPVLIPAQAMLTRKASTALAGECSEARFVLENGYALMVIG